MSANAGACTAIDVSGLDQSLLALLNRIGAREVRALDALYEVTVDRLYALASKVSGDPRDGEEVVADVYHYVWEHVREFDAARGSVLAWLSMLTWSRASDRRRRRKPEQSFEALHPSASPNTYTESESNSQVLDLDAFIDGHRVRLALATLAVDQRRLILMAFFEGASHADIAMRTGMPLGTVKSHIRRGMECLRVTLQGDFPDAR